MRQSDGAREAVCSLQTPLNRRGFLRHAAGAATYLSGMEIARQAPARAPEGRLRESFDFGWKFLCGDAPGAEQLKFPDASWRSLDLPHDWSIEGPYDENASSGGPGGYVPTGIGWYRKPFRVPASHEKRKVFIELDGVYENSEVWINGRSLGKRPFGYISVHYDLTADLRFDAENLLAVKVDNSHQPNSRWYSGSGIYRHTWLLVTNPVHIAQWGTFVTTPSVSTSRATVRVRTSLVNDNAGVERCELTSSVLDQQGRVVGRIASSGGIEGGRQRDFLHEIHLETPRLWSVETPYLYTLRSTVRVNGQPVDAYDTPFGVRSAAFDADQGFLLNGERVKLKGACLHHDGGAVGAAVPERVWERRLALLKEMGCNAVRTSHNPAAPELLDLCDEMGFLVMNEIFDEWKVPKGQIGPYGYSRYFDEWSERDVTDFVRRDRNHPSVVLWSAGNEVGDQKRPEGVETLRRLLAVFHREDPTRLVTVGCDQIAAEPQAVSDEFLALLDVVGYNYVDRWRDRREKYFSIDRDAHPERRVIGTESSGMGGVRGDYRALFPGEATGPGLRRAGASRRVDVEQLWKFVGTYDYVAGDFMWTGIDYLGEARWPRKGASSGVLDTCGFKKDGYYFYQSQWTHEPMLHLLPHWNWKGREGQLLPVTCYTNCDIVELFLNDRSLGVKGYAFPRPGMEKEWGTYPPRALVPRTTADLHLSWDVPYEPGTLRAVGTKDGRMAAQVAIETTGEPAAIRLTTDRASLRADRRDLAHVVVEIIDDHGRVVPDADAEITFSVRGEGRLIGLDNGNPESHEDYKGRSRRACHGLCLALVQSTARAGQVDVTGASPDLRTGRVTLTSA